ncbi:sensor histidine kinase [Filimonas effusa]|nr:7TM diverse intracellular signaling domain-containing protein [Filimonas effusa]
MYPCIGIHAADSTICITENRQAYYLNTGGWSIYETTSPLSPSDVIERYKQNAFKPARVPVLNGGIARQHYWIHFSLTQCSGSHAESMVIDIQSPRLNELELFEMKGDSLQSLGKLGDLISFKQRSSLHKNFQYHVTLPAGSRRDYFLFVNQVGHTLLLPVVISKKDYFDKTVTRGYLSDGITYGLLLFVAIFSFLFFMNTRHQLYLYYTLYILSSIVWFLSYFGLGFEFIWPNFPAFNTISAPLFASLNLFLNIQISQVLLNLKHSYHRIYRAGNVAKFVLLLAALLPAFVNLDECSYAVNSLYLHCFLAVIMCSTLIVFTALLLALLKGAIAARYYFVASILKICSIFNLALLELGITPGMYFTEAFLQIGILVEIILLTYAIAKRYTSYRLKTYQKVIRAQEKERDNIAREIHDGISSSLTAVRYSLLSLSRNKQLQPDALQHELSRLGDNIGQIQTEARNISHNLMPAYIKDHSLNRVIELYIADLQQKTAQNGDAGIEILFDFNETEARFSEAVKLSIFRIVQEIMINAVKHARASSVLLEFSYRKNELTIVAEDNGIGIGAAALKEINGIGLRNIKSRVSLLNGYFIITAAYRKDTASGQGTRITIRIPLSEKMNSEEWDY